MAGAYIVDIGNRMGKQIWKGGGPLYYKCTTLQELMVDVYFTSFDWFQILPKLVQQADDLVYTLAIFSTTGNTATDKVLFHRQSPQGKPTDSQTIINKNLTHPETPPVSAPDSPSKQKKLLRNMTSISQKGFLLRGDTTE